MSYKKMFILALLFGRRRLLMLEQIRKGIRTITTNSLRLIIWGDFGLDYFFLLEEVFWLLFQGSSRL
jgi:hypothetical protein